MSPERELLIACARTSVDPQGQERIRVLVQGRPDWSHLIQLARLHGTRPFLYRVLSTTCAGLVPSDVWRQLQGHYCAVALQNARMTRALVDVVEVLRTHAIAALPLKGPALAALANGTTLREFGDLDVLIRKQDVNHAIDALLRSGFVSRSDTSANASDRRDRKYHLLERQSDGIHVDLQWRIASKDYSFSLEHEAFWERPHPILLSGRTIPGLSPEATLLVLCIHGSKHLWSRLKWVCDVAELLRGSSSIDWDRTFRMAAELHCTRMLLLGSTLARDLLDAPMPGPVLDRAGKHATVRRMAARYARALRMGEEPQEASQRNVADYLLLRDRGQDRLRYLLHLCRTLAPGDRAQLPLLPMSSRAVFYTLLPFRLIATRVVRARRMKAALAGWLEHMG